MDSMEDSRIPHQATQWELKGYKRKPRRDWTTKDKLDGHREMYLKNMDITWEEAKELAADRIEWRQRVAHQQDAG